MINVWIDELTPCLIDNATRNKADTEVITIKKKSDLLKFNKRTGWYTNWSNLVNNNDIFALVLKGTCDIQGLVAIEKNYEMNSAFVSWMVASPENNKQIVEVPKYSGVGGHLFAIAAEQSIQKGFNGEISGFAANKELLNHYIEKFGAEHLGMLHEYHMAIYAKEANLIMEKYTYERRD